MIGTTLAHYRITAALGAGGMGEVWRASDTRLGREVAVKLLPAEMAADPERLDRFEREARAVASLNHPHIVTIYSVEEADGNRFLTMELVEGATLEGMISEGGLDLETLFDLAIPLAEAISAAHDKSVIHRDLKPSNVMVDADGRVKVLDFGLAKLQQAEGVSDSSALLTEAMTGIGTIVGTVPYMSPEQVEGKIVDHRTDIFSLGVLLYEMATGERPFRGSSSPGLMSSILKDDPTPVLELRADLPRHLGRVISRCLAKDRRDRYQTARDVYNELRALRLEASSSTSAASAFRTADRASSGRRVRTPSDDSASASTRRQEGFWVAVLPFKSSGGDADLVALAEGFTEDIVTGLSRFSYLRVIARVSTLAYAGETVDARAVGDELGARYVMEGSLRRAGRKLRISAQLVDTVTGAHLWAETFDRDYDPEELFDLQDDVVPRIVSTCADHFGVLARAISDAVRGRPIDELSPYEALMRGFGYHFRLSPEEHAQAREALERAIEQDPANADCQAMLAWVYAHEIAHQFNPRPGALDRALAAARKAVDLAPSNHLAQQVLAVVSFFRGNTAACRSACERALSLNPIDGSNEAIFLTCFTGDWERGCALIRRAMELNPHHPRWYGTVLALDEYRKKNYRGAVDAAIRANAFDLFWTHWLLAAAHGQLGAMGSARRALDDLLALKPNFAQSGRQILEKWFQPELVEHFVEGLRKAGLDLGSSSPGSAAPRKLETAFQPESSRDGRAGIAVLPFADMSPTKDQDYLCEGMAEEIMNALVQVGGIRVASRTSTFRAVEGSKDLRAIGDALSVGHILEGSIRMASGQLRVTAQLTEVESGFQLWSERYDRDAADVFAVQDEIAAGVVAAVTSQLDSGARPVRARSQVGNLEAYRHYLKGRHYRYSKNDHASALASYERALALDPTHGPSWVGKAEVTVLAAVYSLIPSLSAYATAKGALTTARELQGESAEGSYVEGMIAVCENRWRDAERALLRAIELAPNFVQGHAWHGFMLSITGRFDEADAAYRKARELDPLAAYPYAMSATGMLTAGRCGEAADLARQALEFEPVNTLALWCLGIARVAMGELEEGLAALEEAAEHARRAGFILGVLAWGLAAAGRRGEARAVLDELESRTDPAPTVVPVAWALAALGEVEAAWRVLELGENEHQGIMCFAGMPPFEPLRRDARFPGLLDRLGLPTGSTSTVPPRIAVLPFVDHSSGADQEWFAAGTHEALLAALQKIEGLRVTSRTSSMRYRATTLSMPEIAEELRVSWLVEGSVARDGDRMRVSASLVNGAADRQVWSGQFERDVRGILALQSEVAQAIASEIRVALSPEERGSLAQTPKVDPAAYRAYILGLHHFDRVTPSDFRRAVSLFLESIAIDGDFLPAHAALVFAHGIAVEYGWIARADVKALVRTSVEAASRLSPESGEALHALADFQFHFERDFAGAERTYQRAAKRTANAYVRFGLGWLLSQSGRHAEAVAVLEEAAALDPRSALIQGDLGWWLFGARDYDRAIEQARCAIELDDTFPEAHWLLAAALAQQGRFDDALREFERYETLYGEPVRWFGGYLKALTGRRDEARRDLEQLERRRAPGVERAQILLGLGDRDGVIQALETAESPGVVFQPYLWPEYEAYHDDPTFRTILDRFSLPLPAPPSDFATGRRSEERDCVRSDSGASPAAGSSGTSTFERRASGNLPLSVDSFVAREEEMAEVSAALRDSRLVTLVGVGGTGKTRLAIETARQMAGELADGTWLAELAPVTKADAVPHVVADLVGAVQQPGKTITESIIDSLRHRALLLVLDNCEHVLDAAAELAEAIATRCARIRILATSRESLAIRGEHVIRLQSLADEHGAVLFRDRARAAGAHGELDTDTLARLSRRLDGMPLAIELAAARCGSMSPEEIEKRLDDRFRLLRGSRRGRMERHQTLRNTVAWSYEMLEPVERQVFDRLSAFAGGFTREAAVAVAGGDDVSSFEVEDAIESLVARSMVLASNTENGTRHRLLETLRQFGEEQLVASGDAARIHDRHLRFFTDFMVRAWSGLWSDDDPPWIRAVGSEFENLRVAVDAAIEREDGVALTALLKPHLWWAWHALRYEVADWAEAALEVDPEPACVRAVASHLMMHGGRPDDAVRLVEESDGWVDQGDPDAECLWALAGFNRAILTQSPELMDRMHQWIEAGQRTGNAAHTAAIKSIEVVFRVMAGETEEARRIGIEAYEEARATGNQAAQCWATFMLGRAYSDSEPWLALEHFERAAEIADRVGLHLNGGFAATEAAVVIARFEAPNQGQARLVRALRSFINSGDHRQLWTSAHHLAFFLTRVDRFDDARSIWQELGDRQAWAAQHHRDELEALLGPHGESELNDDELVDRIRSILDALDSETA